MSDLTLTELYEDAAKLTSSDDNKCVMSTCAIEKAVIAMTKALLLNYTPIEMQCLWAMAVVEAGVQLDEEERRQKAKPKLKVVKATPRKPGRPKKKVAK